jgi:hypothetical protein
MLTVLISKLHLTSDKSGWEIIEQSQSARRLDPDWAFPTTATNGQ